jgi:CubicO group peptidase (beta-lactamase class C family)
LVTLIQRQGGAWQQHDKKMEFRMSSTLLTPARILTLGMVISYVGGFAPLMAADNSASQLPDGFEAQVKAIVEEERVRAGVPAMSIAVVANGKIVTLYASGMADVEANIPATAETLFPAASVSKLLTAVMVMQQVEKGSLSLDTKVNDLLPPERQLRDASGAPVVITVRQLLSHSSGLEGGRGRRGYQPDPTACPILLDEYLSNGLVTVEPPGTTIIYSSNGFALAGWLAAHMEGKSFEDFAQQALFSPLEMQHSSFKAPNDVGPDLAAGYGEIGLGFNSNRVPHPIVTSTAPSGSLTTTASDLGKFAIAILNGGVTDGVRVIDAKTLDVMTHIVARPHSRMPEGFGLGFSVNETPGRKLIWWDGSLAGAASRLALLPDQKVGVAILTNLQDGEAPTRTATRILDLLAPSPGQSIVQVDAAELARLSGKYRLMHALDKRMWFVSWLAEISVQPTDGGLRVSTPVSRNPVEFVPVGPNLFQTKGNAGGSYLLFEGDDLYLSSAVHGKRMPMLQSSRAIMVYLGFGVLLILSLVAWGLYSLIRRMTRAGRLAKQQIAR